MPGTFNKFWCEADRLWRAAKHVRRETKYVRREPLRFALLVTFVVAMAGCAMKVVPPLPATLKYPEFVYPAPPAAAREAAAIDLGWRFLQNDDLANAEREFAVALKGAPDSAAARTGEGYVTLARHD